MEKRGSIEIEDLEKYYGDNHVVSHLNLRIQPGEFTTFLGPSGCGKTTILRMIAGFETIDGGSICIDGEEVTGLPPNKRKVHTVFQQYALFPHMNVYDNIAYGLRAQRKGRKEIDEAVSWALDMVSLPGFEKRMPAQMSGGQKQRVSIARAIVNRPSVLLLDEPLTALDMKLRKEMRYKLRELQQQLGITFIYVTHDQEEAMVMSDRIVVLSEGKIEQEGTPREIYTLPDTAFVSDFIGDTNSFDGAVEEISDGQMTIVCESGSFLAAGRGFEANEYVNISIRPHLTLWSENPADGFSLSGEVTDFVFTGSFTTAMITLASGRTVRISRLAGEGLPQAGQKIYVFWRPEDAVVMKNPLGNIHKTIEDINLGDWIQK